MTASIFNTYKIREVNKFSVLFFIIFINISEFMYNQKNNNYIISSIIKHQ